jgi:peptidoglycan/LPS O-acetylase OafA/YrhL
LNTRRKKITAMILAWIMGSLAGAGILAVLQTPADKNYWSSVATLSALMLAIVIASWVRDERPKRDRGLGALALVLIIPALILGYAFGLGPALGALAGGLTGVLIITWPYLTGKEPAPKSGG